MTRFTLTDTTTTSVQGQWYEAYVRANGNTVTVWRRALPDGEFQQILSTTDSQVVATALSQRSCAPVANYALETARAFTSFYHECPVLNAETDALRTARAQLCAATLQTLENALHLLGIQALERM